MQSATTKTGGGGAYEGALNQTYQMCHGIKFFDDISKFVTSPSSIDLGDE